MADIVKQKLAAQILGENYPAFEAALDKLRGNTEVYESLLFFTGDKFTATDENCMFRWSIFWNHGGVGLVSQAALSHLDDQPICLTACAILVDFMQFCQELADDNSDSFEDSGGLTMLVNCMHRHAADVNIQKLCAKALGTYASKCASKREHMSRSISTPSPIALLLKAMEVFPEVVSLQFTCVWALVEVSCNTVENKQAMMALQVVPSVLKTLQRLPTVPQLHCCACNLLNNLANSFYNSVRDEFLDNNGIALILQSVQDNAVSREVQLRACQMLQKLAQHSTLVCDALRQKGAIPIFQAIKEKWRSCEDVEMNASRLLDLVSLCDAAEEGMNILRGARLGTCGFASDISTMANAAMQKRNAAGRRPMGASSAGEQAKGQEKPSEELSRMLRATVASMAKGTVSSNGPEAPSSGQSSKDGSGSDTSPLEWISLGLKGGSGQWRIQNSSLHRPDTDDLAEFSTKSFGHDRDGEFLNLSGVCKFLRPRVDDLENSSSEGSDMAEDSSELMMQLMQAAVAANDIGGTDADALEFVLALERLKAYIHNTSSLVDLHGVSRQLSEALSIVQGMRLAALQPESLAHWRREALYALRIIGETLRQARAAEAETDSQAATVGSDNGDDPSEDVSEHLSGLNVRELKAALIEFGVDFSDCLEKPELEARLAEVLRHPRHSEENYSAPRSGRSSVSSDAEQSDDAECPPPLPFSANGGKTTPRSVLEPTGYANEVLTKIHQDLLDLITLSKLIDRTLEEQSDDELEDTEDESDIPGMIEEKHSSFVTTKPTPTPVDTSRVPKSNPRPRNHVPVNIALRVNRNAPPPSPPAQPRSAASSPPAPPPPICAAPAVSSVAPRTQRMEAGLLSLHQSGNFLRHMQQEREMSSKPSRPSPPARSTASMAPTPESVPPFERAATTTITSYLMGRLEPSGIEARELFKPLERETPKADEEQIAWGRELLGKMTVDTRQLALIFTAIADKLATSTILFKSDADMLDDLREKCRDAATVVCCPDVVPREMLSEDRERLVKENKLLKTTNETLQDEVQAQQEARKQAQNELQKLQKKHEKVSKTAQQLNEQLSTLQTDTKHSDREAKRWQKRLTEVEEQMAERQAAMEELREQLKAEKSKQKEITDSMQALYKERKELRQQKKDLEMRVKASPEEHVKTVPNNEKLEKEMLELQEENRRLQNELEQARQTTETIRQLQRAVEEWRAKAEQQQRIKSNGPVVAPAAPTAVSPSVAPQQSGKKKAPPPSKPAPLSAPTSLTNSPSKQAKTKLPPTSLSPTQPLQFVAPPSLDEAIISAVPHSYETTPTASPQQQQPTHFQAVPQALASPFGFNYATAAAYQYASVQPAPHAVMTNTPLFHPVELHSFPARIIPVATQPGSSAQVFAVPAMQEPTPARPDPILTSPHPVRQESPFNASTVFQGTRNTPTESLFTASMFGFNQSQDSDSDADTWMDRIGESLAKLSAESANEDSWKPTQSNFSLFS
eukprot:TRINITY_DN308_c0_g1_i1.p1 TRINITY_DN308_c0_g1~~TRINITY_DN308_c0_g1_i1.p1  ORF type:complete len:1482 (+),score=252.27 TRINITY_DN308_c0_g1_i1:86-4531(+)